ncbi:MAG: ATP-dependent helicase [Salinarchaeum sp.]
MGITAHLDRATNTLVVDATDATRLSRRRDTPAAVRADGGPRGVSDPLRFDQVVAVEQIAHDGPIVDLSVPDLHNFVGGSGGLLLHNTLASFSKIIDDLARRDADGGLENSVYCLYVSPLKSLANDIHRNLTQPLSEIEATEGELGIRHAIRHGDTDSSERQRMLEETPHILNTTPETLAILLNSPKFREKLRTVEYVIVDEIHAIAESKRGTHLAVSLERLEALAAGSPTRIGCSATIEPLSAVGEFLVGRESPGGPSRPFEVVDTRFAREYDLELLSPTDDLINTPREVITERFYDRLDRLIRDHTNTIVFANTRSGAERILHNLREHYAYDESNSGCHHGSLSKTQRERIEAGLKDGVFDVVTSSTSLALGIDMPEVDLVVQVGSPKSVAELLQRIGRAGHRVGQTVTGRVIALDRDELVECAIMLKKAKEGFVDSVSIPENAQDVAAQHVYGMAIAEIRPEREVRQILRQAYPYREYTDAAYEQLMRYLTADYEGMEDRDVYAKVWRDTNDPPDGEHHYEEFPVGEPLIGKRGRLARMIYMTNIGTIPDSFSVDVFTRADDEWVGDLDEEYLDTLESGDVFVLGGERFEYQYRRGSKVYVDRTAARPTVPSWYSERLPLSFDLGREILRFQGALLDHLEADGPAGVRAWLRTFPLDDDSVRALTRLYDAQRRYAGSESVSTDRRIAVDVERDREEYRRHYHVRTGYGRRFNDGLSRLLAYHAAQETTANVSVAVADHGFTLTMPLNRKVDLVELIESLDPAAVRSDLRASLNGTDLLKRYFRIDATRALMILKRYKGHEKSASQQQVSSEMLLSFAEDLENFAVIEETYREILEDKLNVEAIEWFCQRVQAGDLTVVAQTLETPSPRSFGLATLAASDVVLAEDESAVLQEFHQRVMDEIGDSTDGALADES